MDHFQNYPELSIHMMKNHVKSQVFFSIRMPSRDAVVVFPRSSRKEGKDQEAGGSLELVGLC